MKKPLAHSHGFSLIELSIVVIIIGLMLGSVVVGRHIISAVHLRKTISDLRYIEGAINEFRIKYNCLPGDCRNAVALGLGAQNGNGNNYLEPIGWNSSQEAYHVFVHLSAAKVIAGDYGVGQWYPTSVGTDTSIVYDGFYNWTEPGAYQLGKLTEGTNSLETSITPKEANLLDNKLDDGVPDAGKMRGAGGGSFSSFAGGDTAIEGDPGCILTPGVHVYNITSTGADCVIVYCEDKNCVWQ